MELTLCHQIERLLCYKLPQSKTTGTIMVLKIILSNCIKIINLYLAIVWR